MTPAERAARLLGEQRRDIREIVFKRGRFVLMLGQTIDIDAQGLKRGHYVVVGLTPEPDDQIRASLVLAHE